MFLSKNKSLSWPTWLLPSVQKNHNNYIISLANLCRWLATEAENLGVEIFQDSLLQKFYTQMIIRFWVFKLGDMGVDKDGNKKDSYEPGININAKVTVFAEGCRGHLGKELIKKYNLSEGKITSTIWNRFQRKFGKLMKISTRRAW